MSKRTQQCNDEVPASKRTLRLISTCPWRCRIQDVSTELLQGKLTEYFTGPFVRCARCNHGTDARFNSKTRILTLDCVGMECESGDMTKPFGEAIEQFKLSLAAEAVKPVKPYTEKPPSAYEEDELAKIVEEVEEEDDDSYQQPYVANAVPFFKL